MGTNTLETAYVNGQTIDAAHTNELTQALLGSFVGRDTSGVPTTGRSLGTLALPWGNIYADGLILGGVALDVSAIVSAPNRIISGKMRTLSSMPDFLRANGAALTFQVLGATTNLLLAVNNVATAVTTDVTKTGFSAAPSSQNTCLVNDAAMSNDKYAGEDGQTITIDTVGTEISGKVGQIIALKNGSEIMLAYVNSATQLTNVYRGFFFDSSGNPLVRENLSNNSTLTILSLGWVFIEDNGTTVDVSYKSPTYSYSSPSGPTTGDYWYDLANNVWKRYSGSSFEIINRTLVGVVAADGSACIGSRCFDFSKSFSDLNTIETELFSTEVVRTKSTRGLISVYGTIVERISNKWTWNITTDLETGLTEASSTVYYLYLSDKGQSVISTEKPYYRHDLKGDYHPYHSWRLVGMAYNDGSNNFITIWDENTPIYQVATTGSGTFTTSSATFVDVTNQVVNILVRKPTKVVFETLRDETVASGSFVGFYAINSGTNQQSEYALSLNAGTEELSAMYYESLSAGAAIIHQASTFRRVKTIGTGFYQVKLRAKKSGANDFHLAYNMKFSAKEV